MTELSQTIDLSPEKKDACPCGSHITFGQCCGDPNRREPPQNIVIRHQALADKRCDEITKYLNKQNKRWLTVSTGVNGLNKMDVERHPHRVTQTMRLGKYMTRVSNLISDITGEIIRERFCQTLQWIEKPEPLYYTAGGYYLLHADSEINQAGTNRWQKIIDRDYSVILYLNDDFTGGDIRFNAFNYAYHPQKGDLIFFPSDHRYVHTAETVTSGFRYAVVSWCAVRESVKVKPGPPKGAIMVK